MKTNDHTFFANHNCKFYPCHSGVEGGFNCLFCYCPLYGLGDQCGGSFTYTESGKKDCSNCQIPHSENAHHYITRILTEGSQCE